MSDRNLSIQGEKIDKCVFIVFFQGDLLKGRVKKISER